jgi:hypothetical protein
MVVLSLERRTREADVLTPKKRPSGRKGMRSLHYFHYFANDFIQIDAH